METTFSAATLEFGTNALVERKRPAVPIARTWVAIADRSPRPALDQQIVPVNLPERLAEAVIRYSRSAYGENGRNLAVFRGAVREWLAARGELRSLAKRARDEAGIGSVAERAFAHKEAMEEQDPRAGRDGHVLFCPSLAAGDVQDLTEMGQFMLGRPVDPATMVFAAVVQFLKRRRAL